MSDHAFLSRLNQSVQASRGNRHLFEDRLTQRVQAIKDNRRPLTLLKFLRVLLDHHVLQEEVGAEKADQKRADYLQQESALATYLEKLATGKTPKVPLNLKGTFAPSGLRRAIAEYLAEVDKTNQANKERNPTLPEVSPNWRELAFRLVCSKSSAATLYGAPATPWERVVGKLIGKCQAAEMGETFVREWVAREAEFSTSDPRAAELARLDSDETQRELLADLRSLFPREAGEWFGPPEATQPDTFDSRLSFDETTHTIHLDGKSYSIAEPKAFALYMRLAAQKGAPITRQQLRSSDLRFRGDKTVPRLRDKLPRPLRNTVRSNNSGYWLQLPDKQIRA
jgi:hypothetical protein